MKWLRNNTITHLASLLRFLLSDLIHGLSPGLSLDSFTLFSYTNKNPRPVFFHPHRLSNSPVSLWPLLLLTQSLGKKINVENKNKKSSTRARYKSIQTSGKEQCVPVFILLTGTITPYLKKKKVYFPYLFFILTHLIY